MTHANVWLKGVWKKKKEEKEMLNKLGMQKLDGHNF